MVEGGPTVAASFVAADLVDEAVLIRSAKPIGESGIAPEGMALDALTKRLKAEGGEELGGDTLEHYARQREALLSAVINLSPAATVLALFSAKPPKSNSWKRSLSAITTASA